ncbi:putative MFS transporter [Patellaria atrata CBS 101060]|uniref:Efflux pump dotC n=1 Tax=Patellaria atrata CBS 101060 TaxID=1346257 RepID=A0A9P4S9E0_9PEZI|nr:putative MFS transporter [Patellaria atrata CBS 101060]
MGNSQDDIGISKANSCDAPITSEAAPAYQSITVPMADITGIGATEIEMIPLGEGGTPTERPKERSKFRMLAILTALFLSLFVAALDQTIVATAIPTISAQLHSASGYTWIGGAYLLANAAAAPIWAKLSDIWGRKPILLSAVATFFASSIICATAKSMRMLIVGRSLQGAAGGGLIQLVNIVLSDLFSMRSRSLYLGLLEMMWALAGGIGPILGGAFTELVSWRWSFWINLPVSGSTFLLLLFFLDVHNPRTKVKEGIKAIDWFGSISILAFMLMLLIGLNFGGVTFPWDSPKVICLVVIGALMSIFFIYSEKKLARFPLMPLRLFHHRSNVASLLVCSAQGFVFIAGEYYLPLYFQSVKEASPLRSGVLILPITITEALMGITVGLLIHRTGRYFELIWIGMILLTIGNGLYIHFNATTSIAEIVGFQLIAGIGAGMLFEPPLIALQALVSQDDCAAATATLGFVRNLSTSLSIVIGGVVFQNSMNIQVPKLEAAGVPSNITHELSGGDAAANVMLVRNISGPAHKMAVKEAFAWSLRNMWILYTCVAAIGCIASPFIVKQALSDEHQETTTGIKMEMEVKRKIGTADVGT